MRIQLLTTLVSRRLIIFDYSRHSHLSRLTLRGEKKMARLPAHLWTGISQPALFPRRSWLMSPLLLHCTCCTSPRKTLENHPPLCLGSWSPPETHGAGGTSLSPPGAPSGRRPVSAVPQADRRPVQGPVSSGWCPHTATISFSYMLVWV